MPDHILESGDSPDLEALFDSIAQQQHQDNEDPAPAATPTGIVSEASAPAATSPATGNTSQQFTAIQRIAVLSHHQPQPALHFVVNVLLEISFNH